MTYLSGFFSWTGYETITFEQSHCNGSFWKFMVISEQEQLVFLQ
jgi:hypothetical protein